MYQSLLNVVAFFFIYIFNLEGQKLVYVIILAYF